MKKPRIEAEEQQPRKIIRAGILTVSRLSLQVAPRYGRGRLRGRDGVEEQIPDAASAGL